MKRGLDAQATTGVKAGKGGPGAAVTGQLLGMDLAWRPARRNADSRKIGKADHIDQDTAKA